MGRRGPLCCCCCCLVRGSPEPGDNGSDRFIPICVYDDTKSNNKSLTLYIHMCILLKPGYTTVQNSTGAIIFHTYIYEAI